MQLGLRKFFLNKPHTRKDFLDCQTVDPCRHALLLFFIFYIRGRIKLIHTHDCIYQITLFINPFLVLSQDVKVGARLNLCEGIQVFQTSFPIYIL